MKHIKKVLLFLASVAYTSGWWGVFIFKKTTPMYAISSTFVLLLTIMIVLWIIFKLVDNWDKE